MNILNSFLLVFKTLTEIIFKVLSPILIIIVLWIIVTIIYRYIKYGTAEFNIFKRKKQAKFIDIVLSMIDKIGGYRKIYCPNNFYSDLIIVDKTGVYLLKLTKYFGIVTGDREAKKLKNQLKIKEVLDIDNPFYYLKEDLKKIDTNLNVKILLVTSNTVNIKINGVSKDECLMLKDFYYFIEHSFKQDEHYSNKEIDSIYSKLKEQDFKNT